MRTIKKIFPLLFLCLLTALSGYSQKTYPQRVVIEKDTFCLITIIQVREINTEYERGRHDEQIISSLRNSLSMFRKISVAKEGRIKNLQTQIAAKDTIIKGYEEEILIRSKLQNKTDNHVTLLKWERGILFIGVAILTGKIIIK